MAALLRQKTRLPAIVQAEDNVEIVNMTTAAILLEDGYEDMEFWYPRYRLAEAGVKVIVFAAEKREYTGKHGYKALPDRTFSALRPEDFHAVIIPGGTAASEALSKHAPVVSFVKTMLKTGKVVAAICHAGWVLAATNAIQGKHVTCYPGIADDMGRAGAIYEDKQVVVDRQLVTSRVPDDLPYFMRETLRLLG